MGNLFRASKSYVCHFTAICDFEFELPPGNTQIRVKLSVLVTLKFDRWHWTTIGHIFYATPSVVHYDKAIGELKLELQSRNAHLGSKLAIVLSHVTVKFDVLHWKTITHLFYATSSFLHHFVAICEFKVELRSGNYQTGAFFYLCDLDLWPWLFAWTSLLSMVITPENFMMIRWQEHCGNGVTDGGTDGRFLDLFSRK